MSWLLFIPTLPGRLHAEMPMEQSGRSSAILVSLDSPSRFQGFNIYIIIYIYIYIFYCMYIDKQHM